MKLITVLLFSVLCITMQAQQTKIDSLKQVYETSLSLDNKLSALEKLNKALINNSSLQESLPYFKEMATIAQEIGVDSLEILGYKYMSEVYMQSMDSSNTFLYAQKALEIAVKNNNTKTYMACSNQLGRAYHHFQLYEKAVATYQNGIDDYYDNENKNDLPILALLYSNLSGSYTKLGKSNKSLEALLKSLKAVEQTNDATQKSYTSYLLGYNYMNIDKYDKAEEYFLYSLQFSDSVSSLAYVYMNHHALGINYSRWGKFKKALYHNMIALDYYKNQGNNLYEFDVLNNTAVLYVRMQQPDSVIYYGKLALKKAEEMNHKLAIIGSKLTLSNAFIDKKQYEKAERVLLEAAKDTVDSQLVDNETKSKIYFNLSEVYEGKKNFNKSLFYYKQFKQWNDTISKATLDSKFANIETKYQTEKKEKELAQQKIAMQEQDLLIQKANIRNWLLLVGVLALVASVFFIYKRYKAEAKAKQIINQQKTQVEKLQREFHHRIKNDFRAINSYISLVQRQSSNPDFKERLDELKNRVTSMFKVHEILLHENDITQVKAQSYLLELSKNVEQKYRHKNIKLICNVSDTETIVSDKATPFGIVLNEFVTNSYKYAFDVNGGEIHIDFNSDNDNHYLSLKDNGKGLPSDFNINNLRSLGMSIIPMFADLYDGSYQLESNNGVSITLILPKKAA